MKNTIKIMAVVLSLVAFTTSLFAQNHNHSNHKKGHHHKEKIEHNPKMILTKLDSELDLNETQERRILTLLEQNKQKRLAFKEERKGQRHHKKNEIKSQLARVLNKEQMTKLEKFHQEEKSKFKGEKGNGHKKNHKNHGKERGLKNHIEKIKSELNLSNEQEIKIKEIFESEKQEMMKKRSEMKSKKEKMRSKFDKDMKSILSPNQFKKFKALKNEFHKNKAVNEQKF